MSEVQTVDGEEGAQEVTTALTIAFLVSFQLAAVPAMVRIVKRKSSQDLSYWREVVLLAGISFQLAAWIGSGVTEWKVLISPIASGLSVLILLGLILRYRGTNDRQRPGL
jgi:hypothetical protein